MKRHGQISKHIRSPRSQPSLLYQRKREGDLEQCRNKIAWCQRKIAEGEQTSAVQAATIAGGGGYPVQRLLTHTLAEVEDCKRELLTYRELEKKLLAEIHALEHPPAAKVKERGMLQEALAVLLDSRSHVDAQIEAVAKKLRKLLPVRDSLNANIQETAKRLDFSPGTDLDLTRFLNLANSLPAESPASFDWLMNFLGRVSEKEPYIVGSAGAVLPETLADAGVYRPGETALLSKERAALLPSAESPARVPSPQEMEESVRQPEGIPVLGDNCEVVGFRPK